MEEKVEEEVGQVGEGWGMDIGKEKMADKRGGTTKMRKGKRRKECTLLKKMVVKTKGGRTDVRV